MTKEELAKKEYEELSIQAGRLIMKKGGFFSANELAREMGVSIQKARSLLKWIVDNRKFEVETKLNKFKRRAVKVLYEREHVYSVKELWQIALGFKPAQNI
jgi:response regulator of citrate/malate metabolism